jgi:membrane-associated phospholipid phosphatase
MRTPWQLPFRAHEVIFGAFLLITAARLLAAGGAGELCLGFAGMAASIVIMARSATRWDSIAMERARLTLFPVLVNVVYWQLGPVVKHLGSNNWDAALLRADRVLLTDTPAVLLAGWTTPLLTDFLSGCYMLFFPGVLAAFFVALRRPATDGARLFDGLISLYGIGFLGYTLIPAAGPHLAMPDAFATPLTGGWLTDTNAALVASGSNRVDVFPSLHTAITVFLMGSLWPRHRRVFFSLLIPAAGLAVATLYLRYHYAVDVLAGLLLATAALVLNRLPDSHETHPPLP